MKKILLIITCLAITLTSSGCVFALVGAGCDVALRAIRVPLASEKGSVDAGTFVSLKGNTVTTTTGTYQHIDWGLEGKFAKNVKVGDAVRFKQEGGGGGFRCLMVNGKNYLLIGDK